MPETRYAYPGSMVTKKIEPVPLAGGPSDGKTARPETKWHLYLEADGSPMASATGDRVMNGRSKSRTGCYVAQRDRATGRVTHYEWREAKS